MKRETRIRRGKVVEIPEEWRGVVTRPQTIRKRHSKMTHKMRMWWKRQGRNAHPTITPEVDEWSDELDELFG